MSLVTIIDYGIVNLGNVVRGFEHVGGRTNVTMDPDVVRRATRVVLPGVGAFASGMTELESQGLDEAVVEVAKAGMPLMGICLGMQMLMEKSQENGSNTGLGLIPGSVEVIPRIDEKTTRRKVPHIGWSALQPPAMRRSWEGTCLEGTEHGAFCYFVHSYMVVPSDPRYILAQCEYDGLEVCAAVVRDNVTGLQFHPERSGPAGLRILDKFANG